MPSILAILHPQKEKNARFQKKTDNSNQNSFFSHTISAYNTTSMRKLKNFPQKN